MVRLAKIWAATPVQTPDSVGVKLTYTSPAGEGCTPGRTSNPPCSTGFPGTVPVTVVYSLDARDNLRIDYSATTDAPTVLNLTNHSYWVLGGVGSGTINNNQLKLNADRYTPIDSTCPAFIAVARMPEAWPRSAAGTAFIVCVPFGAENSPDPTPLRNSSAANIQ